MYTIRINIPGQEIKEIEITKEQFEKISPLLAEKNIVEVNGYVFNTAYFVDAINTKNEERRDYLCKFYQ